MVLGFRVCGLHLMALHGLLCRPLIKAHMFCSGLLCQLEALFKSSLNLN